MEIKELLNIVKKLAPNLSCQDFSDPGFVSATPSAETHSIVKLGVCVDPTEKNIENAAALGIEVLISYHPWYGEARELVEARRIQIWPLHEAWDHMDRGVLDSLAKEIGLTGLYPKGELLIGHVETGFRDLIENCQRFLGQNILSFSGDLKQGVHKVAMWAGPGFLPIYRKFWETSLSENCDTFLSSELTLSALRFSRINQFKLIDLGHSLLAKPGMSNLADILKKEAQDCSIQFFDDFYVCSYYTGCSFADQFSQSEDIFFRRRGLKGR
jgi:putative NIF3 family GTP cyclohydrolase 1 type 2